jgi:hypothetical protein
MKQIYTKLTTASKWKWMMTFLLLMMGVEVMAQGNQLHLQEIQFSNNSNWLSLTSDYNLYFNSSYDSGKYKNASEEQLSSELECFAFKAVETNDGMVGLKHISVVPRNTPIWIWGTKGRRYSDVVFTFIDFKDLEEEILPGTAPAEFDNIDGNLLKGSISEETTIIDGDYFLWSEDNYVHSAYLAGMINQKFPAGKALLRTNILSTPSSPAKLRLSLVDDDDTAEGIDAICTEKGELIMYNPNKPSYNAAGQLVPGDAKGVHIQNGYKFYIK